MSHIIDTIEGEPVRLCNDGTIQYTAKAAIDGDGSGPSHDDPDYQNDTSLHFQGEALNADLVPYIVVPPAILISVSQVILGCQARVTYNGTECPAVVGDIGPGSKLGEISIACANELGIPSSPTTGGLDDHSVHYVIHPGVPAKVKGVTYKLQRYR